MKRLAYRWIAAVALLPFLGCGTICNLSAPSGESYPREYEPRNEVYGGVRADVVDGWKSMIHPREPGTFVVGVASIVLDAPLSLIGDTVTLPTTVRARIERNKREAQAANAPAVVKDPGNDDK